MVCVIVYYGNVLRSKGVNLSGPSYGMVCVLWKCPQEQGANLSGAGFGMVCVIWKCPEEAEGKTIWPRLWV